MGERVTYEMFNFRNRVLSFLNSITYHVYIFVTVVNNIISGVHLKLRTIYCFNNFFRRKNYSDFSWTTIAYTNICEILSYESRFMR